MVPGLSSPGTESMSGLTQPSPVADAQPKSPPRRLMAKVVVAVRMVEMMVVRIVMMVVVQAKEGVNGVLLGKGMVKKILSHLAPRHPASIFT